MKKINKKPKSIKVNFESLLHNLRYSQVAYSYLDRASSVTSGMKRGEILSKIESSSIAGCQLEAEEMFEAFQP